MGFGFQTFSRELAPSEKKPFFIISERFEIYKLKKTNLNNHQRSSDKHSIEPFYSRRTQSHATAFLKGIKKISYT